MASSKDSRASEGSNKKLCLQENEDIGSCNRKDTAIASPLDYSASESSFEKFSLQESTDTGSCHSKDFSVSSPEGSVVDVINGEKGSIESVTKPSNLTIWIPRFNDQDFREHVRLARLHVQEKRKHRDAIRVQIQQKRANSHIHGLDYEYAKGEERSAQKLVKSKRGEINNLLFVISKAKNALVVKDVDSQVFNMEHMIQHKTGLLIEEKYVIRKIKQLKLLREQLSSNLGSQDEIKQALEQREEAEKCLKILRKELDILKDSVSKARAAAVHAGKKFSDENKRLKELQMQLRAANDDLQVAYSQWPNLRKLWSKVEDFTGLVTSDGFSLGNSEESPSLFSCVHESADCISLSAPKANSLSQNTTVELKLNDKLIMKVTGDINQNVIDEGPESVLTNGLVMASSRDAIEEFKQVPKKSEGGTKSTRTGEEMLWAEDEAKLKGKSQLEATKANEACERKKRKAKKIQMREESKSQKEAEEKEKEREKRLRKKEKKAAKDSNDTNSYEGNVESSKGALSVEPKRPAQKSYAFTKQTKARSAPLPPHLRNRNKKMFRQWIYMCLISAFLSIIFWHGYVDVLPSVKLNWD